MMDSADQEAMMAALEHIQETLASVKGIRKPEEKMAGEAPPMDEAINEPDEGSAVEEALDLAEGPSKGEPTDEPERFVEHGGSYGESKPKLDAVVDIAVKRGPGRPKKVR